jgi:hypothetical protein
LFKLFCHLFGPAHHYRYLPNQEGNHLKAEIRVLLLNLLPLATFVRMVNDGTRQ